MPDDLEQRVRALEQALAALRQSPPTGPSSTEAPDDDQFWLLRELKERQPAGAIVYGGTASVAGGEVAWQWGAKSDQLREGDWAPAAPVLDALSHPVRLRLLQLVLNGVTSTAELAAEESLGTTGQLHHHLRALVAGGWLQSVGRGQWSVAPQRVVPLLVVISATTR